MRDSADAARRATSSNVQTKNSGAERREFVFRYRSSAHFIEVFRRFYGPTHKAFAALDAEGQTRLAADIAELSSRFNRRKTAFVVPAEYLEIVIER